jgi:hypothetical protein
MGLLAAALASGLGVGLWAGVLQSLAGVAAIVIMLHRYYGNSLAGVVDGLGKPATG